MTEDEAQKLWCPFARVAVASRDKDDTGSPSFNRACDADGNVIHHRQNRCIGSVCMAWRWHTIVDPARSGFSGRPLPKASDTYGYCGLAGRSGAPV